MVMQVTNGRDFGVNTLNFGEQSVGKWNGRTMVKVDSSYAMRKNFSAGLGPNDRSLERLFSAIVFLVGVFTTFVSTLSVAIATRSLNPTLKTLGVGASLTALFTALAAKYT